MSEPTPGAASRGPAASFSERALSQVIDWAERGRIPDPVLRVGIRRLVADRLNELSGERGSRAQLARELAGGPIAVVPQLANAQHYEVPPDFFRFVLGPQLKYSCALFDPDVRDLADAEAAMLALSCRRAGIEDGMRILDLGCGWGSLSLWIAERYPRCEVVSVSNSKDQGESIREACARRGLERVRVLTADVNSFDPELAGLAPGGFDRVVSVEMFEHVRNWGALLERVASWLAPDGRVFLHTFCHRDRAYLFEDRDGGDWMARHFFSGGMMPSADWILWHQEHLRAEDQWLVSGRHYRDTAEAWLARLDSSRAEVTSVLSAAAGGDAAEGERAFHRWRLFFLAVSELFGWDGGREWQVVHTRLARRGAC